MTVSMKNVWVNVVFTDTESDSSGVLHLLASAGSECWMPVCGVPGSQDVACQGQGCIQLLLVQTGTICSVLIPPAETEAGRTNRLDPNRPRRQLLKTDPQLFGYSCVCTHTHAESVIESEDI